MKAYTVDRIEDGFYVFLLRGDELQELTVPISEISETLSEGDIIQLETINNHYEVKLLKEETEHMKKKVADLLEKLKNKK